MELAGYWGIDDPTLRDRMADPSDGTRLLTGRNWAISTRHSTPELSEQDLTESVIPLRNPDGEVCGLLAGRLHTPSSRALPAFVDAAALDPDSGTDALTSRVWGSYAAAAVLGAGRASRVWFGGDPVGLRTVFWARHRDGVVFASRLADLVDVLGQQPDFDWAHLRGYLAHGELPVTTTGFVGMHVVRPGTRLACDARGPRERTVWNPASLAGERTPSAASPDEVRTVVRQSVNAWAGDAESVYVELSGGLDSAVIAQALAASGRRVVGGHFHHGSSALADELSYARAVAKHLGTELVVIEAENALPLAPVDGAGVRWDAPSGRLPWESLAAAHRRVAAEQGCAAAMTGEGGDQVFLSRPGIPVHLHDHLRSCGLRAAAAQLAVASRVTGSPLARLALDILRWETVGRRGGTALLDHIADAEERPAWLLGPTPPRPRAAAGAVPTTAGKAAQALAVTMLGTRLGNRPADARPDSVLRPLLSQPVVELGLRTPVPALLDSSRDRILLREAMRGLLPDALLDRTSKGEATATWQWGLRTHLTRARDLVSHSAAAAAGIIDPAPAQAVLTSAALGHTGRLWPLLQLLSTELWIRSWTTGDPADGLSVPTAERTHRG